MANKLLTIYISSDAIRVAEMQKSNKTVILSNAAEVPTPQGCFNDGYILDVAAVAEKIRTAIFGKGFSTKDVVFTIGSKKIASKEVEVNYFKKTKKLAEILQANSQEYFPMSGAGDYVFAYSILEDYYTNEERKYRVSAVAAPQDLIRGYYELAEELKLTVNSIDYFGNSVIQLLSLQMAPGSTDLVLQIEKDVTYVNVMRGPVLILQRSVNYGKNAVINTLMDVKKISEKDAKTLLSNERLLDQHVTADEYSQTVSYLVNGIGRAVEYHRQKNPGEEIQGIKIFGEGSSIAGIEKILQRELGAPVQHFETLAGVSIKGQAALTAEEVLRYLPNIGSVIDPMDLTLGKTKKDMISSSDLNKALGIIAGVAFVASLSLCVVTAIQHNNAVKERDRLQAEIDAIDDIEQIAREYEQAQAEFEEVNVFDRERHNDNEKLLTFVNDLERLIPTGTSVTNLKATNGDIEMTVLTGWDDPTKNQIADIMINVAALDYVTNFKVPSFQEEYKYFVMYENEDGELVYLHENDFIDEADADDEEVMLDGDQTEDEALAQLLEMINAGPEVEFTTPLNYQEVEETIPMDIAAYKLELRRQATYTLTCHIGYDHPEEEAPAEEADTEETSEETSTEEGGAE
jgi:type IV pilus assembly protein PilM